MGWQWHKDMVAKPPTSVQEGVTTFARNRRIFLTRCRGSFQMKTRYF